MMRMDEDKDTLLSTAYRREGMVLVVKPEVLSPNNFKKADESLLIGIRASRLSLASLFYQSKTANGESNLHVLSIYYLPGPLLGA